VLGRDCCLKGWGTGSWSGPVVPAGVVGWVWGWGFLKEVDKVLSRETYAFPPFLRLSPLRKRESARVQVDVVLRNGVGGRGRYVKGVQSLVSETGS
jgi:hypothetical protein